MDKAEALRSIRYDLIEYLQEKVRVEFDNKSQSPISFSLGGTTHTVKEILGRYRTRERDPLNAFLVKVSGGSAYYLYFHFCDTEQTKPVHEGYWVLSFRILRDHEIMALYREDRKMLPNRMLRVIIRFHGHLCPELIIGYKLCRHVQTSLLSGEEFERGISIIAENCTSAIDAIQILLGTTLGNLRLQVTDCGKHNYVLLSSNAQTGFRFSLRQPEYADGDLYEALEQKIMNNEVMLEEMVQFQELLDGRVKKLLALSPQELFEVKRIELYQQPVQKGSEYPACAMCGHPILKWRRIDYQHKSCCIPCSRRIISGGTQSSLH
jgi:formylmethanofuran dehydrogenase subunit E